MSENWLPVEPHRVPSPRPGACANDSKSLPDRTLTFIRSHSLMDGAVPPFFGAPVLVRTAAGPGAGGGRLTGAVAVDPQVRATTGQTFDVIFVGTTNGRILKVVNAAAASSVKGVETVVVEELQVFSKNVVVRRLRVLGGGREGRRSLAQVAAMADSEVRSFPVQRCDRAATCTECVALQDPYCAWEVRAKRCSSGDWTRNMASSFLQSVETGQHKGCPRDESAVIGAEVRRKN